MCHFTESKLLIRYSEASEQIQRHNEIDWHFHVFFDGYCVDCLQAVGTGEFDDFLQAVGTGELDNFLHAVGTGELDNFLHAVGTGELDDFLQIVGTGELDNFLQAVGTGELDDFLQAVGTGELDNFLHAVGTGELDNFLHAVGTGELDNFLQTVGTGELDNVLQAVGTGELDNFLQTVGTGELDNVLQTVGTGELDNVLQTVGTGELDNFLPAVDTGELDDFGPDDRVTWLSTVCHMKYAHCILDVTSSLLVVSCHAFAHILWLFSWWRHQMETFSALLALCAGNSPVTGEFPSQRPVTRSFDVFFDMSQNKRRSKQSRRWWFETPSRSLWRHCNVLALPSNKALQSRSHVHNYWGVLYIGANFTKVLWAYNSNIAKRWILLTWKTKVKSGHNFAHTTTA